MRSSGIGGDGNGTDLEREINVLFCEGGLDWSAVRHPRVGRGGDVAAGQVSAPRLLPLHERRHRGLQVTNCQRQVAEFPAKYLGRKKQKKNLLVDSSGAVLREGVHYILVTKREG